MKIELKNINYYLSFYDHYPSYQAELFIKGRLAGKVRNEGYGNACEYEAINNEGALLLKEAEQYCASLPDVNYGPVYGNDEIILKSSLTLELDREFEQYLMISQHVDFEASQDRNMLKGIIYGGLDERAYSIFDFRVPLARILANPAGGEIVKQILHEHILPKLHKGIMVLNTNIAEDILIGAGLKPNQYKLNITKPVKKVKKGKKL
jgi:hypothetical protein